MVAVLAAQEVPDDVPAHVHLLVERWWRVTRDRHRLGFPTQSTVARMMREGTNRSAQSYRPAPVELPPEVVLIDRLIAKMPRLLREVIEGDCRPWQPVTSLAREIGCPRTEYYRRRTAAYAWMAGALEAIASA
jgi:hypothetical protein